VRFYHKNRSLRLSQYADGRGAEKLWKLKVRKVGIDLITGEIFKE